MKYKSAIIIILSLIIGFSTFIFAQSQFEERIISYVSDIVVYEDGSMLVTEQIKVYAGGNRIKRGIYRDFPTRYEDRYGSNVIILFDVLEVLRDGKSEPYHTENLSNGIRVYAGKKDYFLPNGNYTYSIKYKTDRQLGFFDKHDELYWNVTGNGWDYKIEKATASVHLPGSISKDDLEIHGFTGYQESKDKYFKSSFRYGSTVYFETTRTLLPTQGLTIVVMFPKGIIAEPTTEEKLGYFLQDNKSTFIGIAGFFLILIYFSLIWIRVGKDPKKGIIIPLFEPPDNLSPASVRFIAEMGYDDKTFTASVISLAVKKYLKIEENSKDFTLINSEGSTEVLSPDELKILEAIKFKSKKGSSSIIKSKLELKQKNHSTIRSAINSLKKSLKNNYEKVYFFTNRKYFILGFIISLLAIIISASFGTEDQIFSTLWITMWSIGVTALLFAVYKAWKGVMGKGKGKLSAIGSAIFITMFSIPFIIGELVGLYFLSESASPLMIVVIALIFLANILFYHLLKAPTLLGRKIMDKIEGFKLYLATAEQERLDLMKSPEKTPELFEKFLPYALALGVENKWAEKFSNVLNVTAEKDSNYSPLWYSGAGWSTLGASGFASSLSSSLSTTISSSSTAPGSSSGGSGGGGSSGGGGGGGGGGGW